jgi:hypothetical protein
LHSWRQQDPTAALAWLATFRSLAPKPQTDTPKTAAAHEAGDDDACEEPPRPRITSFENMGLWRMEVTPKAVLRVIPMEDVSDEPDDL